MYIQKGGVGNFETALPKQKLAKTLRWATTTCFKTLKSTFVIILAPHSTFSTLCSIKNVFNSTIIIFIIHVIPKLELLHQEYILTNRTSHVGGRCQCRSRFAQLEFFLWRCDPTRVMAYSFLRFYRSHTTTHHSRQDFSGQVISSSQIPVPDNTALTTYKLVTFKILLAVQRLIMGLC